MHFERQREHFSLSCTLHETIQRDTEDNLLLNMGLDSPTPMAGSENKGAADLVAPHADVADLADFGEERAANSAVLQKDKRLRQHS